MVVLYLAVIVLANLVAAHFGPVITIVNAFVLIGFDLVARDALHERWQNHLKLKMFMLISAGSLISYAINSGAGMIALASAVAFALAATVDTLIYHVLRRKRALVRMNGSNVFSAAVDSLAFPTIAFGSFMPLIVFGQFAAKVVGGYVWSVLAVRLRLVENTDSQAA